MEVIIGVRLSTAVISRKVISIGNRGLKANDPNALS